MDASRDRTFRHHFELAGESLKRPPRGFDAAHPQIEDLKRKSFIGVREFSNADAIDAGFQRKVETALRAATPLMRFLCKAVGVPY